MVRPQLEGDSKLLLGSLPLSKSRQRSCQPGVGIRIPIVQCDQFLQQLDRLPAGLVLQIQIPCAAQCLGILRVQAQDLLIRFQGLRVVVTFAISLGHCQVCRQQLRVAFHGGSKCNQRGVRLPQPVACQAQIEENFAPRRLFLRLFEQPRGSPIIALIESAFGLFQGLARRNRGNQGKRDGSGEHPCDQL